MSKLQERFAGVVVLIDEAERLGDIENNERKSDSDGGGFLGPFHDQFHDDDAFRLVIAGSQAVSRLFEVPVSAGGSFLDPFLWIPLPGLSPEEAQRLLQCEQSRTWKPLIDSQLLGELVRFSGGHPLILQKVGSQLAVRSGQPASGPYLGNLVDRRALDGCLAGLANDAVNRRTFDDDFRA